MDKRAGPYAMIALLVVIWGLNWVILKLTLAYLPPIWAVFLRTFPAFLLLLLLAFVTRQLAWPSRQDFPVVLSVAVFHMIGFSVLVSLGMQHMPAGRSIVIAYTTPLWVIPIAAIVLKERINRHKIAGLALGMAGLFFIMEPNKLDWDADSLLVGKLLILGGAFSWALSIVYGRAHRWHSTPFRVLPWQLALASAAELIIAWGVEGSPAELDWNVTVLIYLSFSAVIGTALAYWLMNTVSRDLPASSASLILLGVPVLGILCSALILDEAIDINLLVGATLTLLGIFVAIGRPTC